MSQVEKENNQGIICRERQRYDGPLIQNQSLPEQPLQSLTPEDQEFWQNQAPEAISIATSSERKAMSLAFLALGLAFPVASDQKNKRAGLPNDYQNYLNQYIPNNNGKLNEKTLLFYFHGVPVYADPQNGEKNRPTDSPEREVKAKVDSLKTQYQNRDVIIIATDAMALDQNGLQFLGKPGESDGDTPQEYLKKHHQDYLVHHQAIYLLRIGRITDKKSNSDDQSVENDEQSSGNLRNSLILAQTVQLSIPIIQANLDELTLHPDVGGGGLAQQIFDFQGLINALEFDFHLEEDQRQLKIYAINQDGYQLLATFILDNQSAVDQLIDLIERSREERQLLAWAIYCYIIGVPWLMIEKMLQKSVSSYADNQSAVAQSTAA